MAEDSTLDGRFASDFAEEGEVSSGGGGGGGGDTTSAAAVPVEIDKYAISPDRASVLTGPSTSRLLGDWRNYAGDVYEFSLTTTAAGATSYFYNSNVNVSSAPVTQATYSFTPSVAVPAMPNFESVSITVASPTTTTTVDLQAGIAGIPDSAVGTQLNFNVITNQPGTSGSYTTTASTARISSVTLTTSQQADITVIGHTQGPTPVAPLAMSYYDGSTVQTDRLWDASGIPAAARTLTMTVGVQTTGGGTPTVTWGNGAFPAASAGFNYAANATGFTTVYTAQT